MHARCAALLWEPRLDDCATNANATPLPNRHTSLAHLSLAHLSRPSLSPISLAPLSRPSLSPADLSPKSSLALFLCVQELAKSTNLGASGTTKMPPATVSLIDKLRTDASSVDFEEVISAIEEGFDVSEVTFTVGEQMNEAGVCEGGFRERRERRERRKKRDAKL